MSDKIKISDDNFWKRAWRKYPVWSNLALMLLSIVIVIWLLLLFVDVWTHHGDTAIVPDVRGLEYEEAVRVLEDADLDVVISDSIDNPGDKTGGMVVEVQPKAGSVVKGGREVYLTIIAYGTKRVTVTEPLANRDLRSVMTVLSNLGIDTAKVMVKRVPWIYPNSVVAVMSGGKTVDMGSSIAVNAPITIELGVEGDLIDAEAASLLQPDSLALTEPAAASDTETPESKPEAPAKEEPTQPAQPQNPLYD